ncbi:putative secreted protein (Por secretion system target) [Tenacibaculum adriaticum]|uniref:Putative secreted protein (Por secretion system target) n=1 Tax=Tenacibaculum adriaticum TaxID=413713 RepID=A0A5S5DQJ7_9FLAO|nr:T9SS type A sorting domain-containing protein [Tenacibaculum adriaticum]TYP98005.1 putative secreted protein (Por secretion system target) [Tenacibaculum adriaticum]
MKQYYFKLLLIPLFTLSIQLYSQTPGTMDFGPTTVVIANAVNPSHDYSNNSLDPSDNARLNGFDMSGTSNGSIFLALALNGNSAGTDAIGGPADAVLGWIGDGTKSVITGTLKTDSGGEIGLTSMHFAYELSGGSSPSSFTFTGKKDGITVGTIVLTSPLAISDISLDFTSPTTGSFTSIDEIVFEPSTPIFGGFSIDDMVVTTASTCTAPDVPTAVFAPPIICDGNSSLLTISGAKNDATEWRVYTGSCGGTLVGSTTGSTIIVTPTPPSTTYYIRGEGGCTTPGACVTITINTTPREDASFSYGAAAYCVDAADPTPTITGVSGGTFSAPGGLSINATTGTIDVSASTPNTYAVSYETNGLCYGRETASITINPIDDASFSYGTAAYCVDGADPTPTITGVAGGTFSSTAGLSMNATTGTIDVSASTPSIYTITYTTAGACSNTSQVSVTINAIDNASFSYAAAAYCVDGADPTPTITGVTGGTFSSTAGLSINATTGTIDVSASTPNTYNVTYTTTGTCPNTSQVNVTINALDDASFSYGTAAYSVTDLDPTPSITGLAGGNFTSSPVGLVINPTTGVIDVSLSLPRSYTITYTTTGTCSNSSDVNITITGFTWTAAINDDWSEPINWANGIIPTSSDDVVIPNIINSPIIYGVEGITVKNISIDPASTITVNSGGSLIATGTASGNITYKRTLTSNWHLVSSPLANETFEDIIANNALASGTGTNIGIAPYKNDGTAWNYLTSASNGTITPGQGFSVKLTSAGNLNFVGSINTNTVTYPITQATNTLNLIGNPYASYINLGNFFSDNPTGPVLSEATIWLWNQATGNYDLKMSGTDAGFQIAPGQGFFVSAGANTNVTFDAANQSHQTDTFQRNSRTEVNLTITENNISKSTKLYYINGTTTGFDNGYDGSLFGGTDYNFALFTELISDNQGKKLAIQSLPNSDFETTIVPVGLIAEAGKEITFSANAMNLPSGVDVYLEDRINGAFSNLSKDTYKVTLNSAANGIGQFYLHTTSQRLSSEDIIKNISNVSIYKSSNQEITITGLQAKANVSVYSILGKELVTTAINSNGISKVSLPTLPTGVYIVKLNSNLGEITKKIILE